MSLCWELKGAGGLPAAPPPVPSPSLPPPRATRWGAPPSSDDDGGSARVPKSSKRDSRPPPQRTRWGSVTPPSSDDGEPYRPTIYYVPPPPLPGKPIVYPPTPPSDDDSPAPPKEPFVIPVLPMHDAIEPVREIVTKLLDGMQRIESLCYRTYRIRNPPVLPRDSREREERPPSDDSDGRSRIRWDPVFPAQTEEDAHLDPRKWVGLLKTVQDSGAATPGLIQHARAMIGIFDGFVSNYTGFLNVLADSLEFVAERNGYPAGTFSYMRRSFDGQIAELLKQSGKWKAIMGNDNVFDSYLDFLKAAYKLSRNIVDELGKNTEEYDESYRDLPGFRAYKPLLFRLYMYGDKLAVSYNTEFHALKPRERGLVSCLGLDYLSMRPGASPSLRFNEFKESVVGILQTCLDEWKGYNAADFFRDPSPADPERGPEDDGGKGWEVVAVGRVSADELSLRQVEEQVRSSEDLIKQTESLLSRESTSDGKIRLRLLLEAQKKILEDQQLEESVLRVLISETKTTVERHERAAGEDNMYLRYYTDALKDAREEYRRLTQNIDRLTRQIQLSSEYPDAVSFLNTELTQTTKMRGEVSARITQFERRLNDLERNMAGGLGDPRALTQDLRVQLRIVEDPASSIARAEAAIESADTDRRRLVAIREQEDDSDDDSLDQGIVLTDTARKAESLRDGIDDTLRELSGLQRKVDQLVKSGEGREALRGVMEELSSTVNERQQQLRELQRLLGADRQLTLERDPTLYKAWLDATLDQERRA